MNERLTDVATLYALLPELMHAAAAGNSNKVSGSRDAPLPGRVDVLNLLGPAAVVHAAGLNRGDQTGATPTAQTLDEIAEDVREQLDMPPGAPGYTVPGIITFLRAQLDRICERFTPLEDFAAALIAVHNPLRDVCGEHRPRTIGACPAPLGDEGKLCGTKLYANTYSDTITCRGCGEKWTRAKWKLLGRIMGMDLIAS